MSQTFVASGGTAIKDLTPHQQEMLCWRCQNGATYSEVGKEFHISINAVKNAFGRIFLKMEVGGIVRACYLRGQGKWREDKPWASI